MMMPLLYWSNIFTIINANQSKMQQQTQPQPPREERYIDKQDSTKNEEFPHLDDEDKKYIDSILTPAAFRALLASEQSFVGLFTIVEQSFEQSRIFCMGTDEKISVIRHNDRFATYYFVIQQRMRHNRQIIMEGITDYDDLVNMSVCFHWNKFGKIAGYTMYTRLTDPDSILGDAIVLAFYHAKLRRVVLLKIPGLGYRLAGGRFIGEHGVTTPFDKACGWCGRAAEDLKKCPCKGPRYCNGECQMLHWKTHKLECGGGAVVAAAAAARKKR